MKRVLATFIYSFVAGVFPLLNVEAYLLAFFGVPPLYVGSIAAGALRDLGPAELQFRLISRTNRDRADRWPGGFAWTIRMWSASRVRR